MSKRFTESGKWTDKWFRGLDPVFKLAWMYVVDSCDICGVLDLDRDLATFQIGMDVDWDAFIAKCGPNRLRELRTGKLFVVRFCTFQYSIVGGKSKYHKRILELAHAHGVHGFLVESGIAPKSFGGNKRSKPSLNHTEGHPKDSLKVQEKDKDKDKDSKKEKGEPEGFAEFWVSYPRKLNRVRAVKAFRSAVEVCRKLGKQDPVGFIVERSSAYAASDEGRKEISFVPYAATWLNGQRFLESDRDWSNGTGSAKPVSQPQQEPQDMRQLVAAQERRIQEDQKRNGHVSN